MQKTVKILGLSLVALSMVTLSAMPASAHRGDQVCKVKWHHGHKVRVCHHR